MKAPRDPIPLAVVPEHLTKLTIDKLPYDKPYYVSPGERDDYEPPVVFVDPNRRLKMSRSYAIDINHDKPTTPLGLVGVMRVVTISDSLAQPIRDVYVADLRFLEDHQLVDSDEITSGVLDQEEYMHWVAELENTIEFSAFIAPEQGSEYTKKNIPPGTMYGDSNLYSALEMLRERSDKIMKKFMRREATAKKMANVAEKASADAKEQGDSNSQKEDTTKKDLSVPFSNR